MKKKAFPLTPRELEEEAQKDAELRDNQRVRNTEIWEEGTSPPELDERSRWIFTIVNQQVIMQALLKIMHDITDQGGPQFSRVKGQLRGRLKKIHGIVYREYRGEDEPNS